MRMGVRAHAEVLWLRLALRRRVCGDSKKGKGSVLRI